MKTKEEETTDNNTQTRATKSAKPPAAEEDIWGCEAEATAKKAETEALYSRACCGRLPRVGEWVRDAQEAGSHTAARSRSLRMEGTCCGKSYVHNVCVRWGR